MTNISQEEHERRLWEAYRHGHKVANGQSKGPDPVTGKMPDDPSQPGNDVPSEPAKPLSREDFVKEILGNE